MKKRFEIIDILRGHFLIAMIIDHFSYIIGTSLLLYYNWNGNLWVSAAEGFVTLSGLMIGYLYVYRQNLTLSQAIKKILKRAFTLYVLSVILTFTYSIFFWKYPLPQSGVFLEGIKPVWTQLLTMSLLFKHQYGWSDILALYAYYLAFTPVIVYFFRKKNFSPIIIISILLWILSNFYLAPKLSVSTFSVLSWQILFVLGVWAGSNFDKIINISNYVFKRKYLIFFILLTFVIFVFLSIKFPEVTFKSYSIFNKGNLGFGRLLLTPLWLASFTIIFSTVFKYIPQLVQKTYEYLGRNSLTVYTIHSVVLAFVTVYITNTGIYINTAIVLIGILIIIALTYLYNFFKSKLKK